MRLRIGLGVLAVLLTLPFLRPRLEDFAPYTIDPQDYWIVLDRPALPLSLSSNGRLQAILDVRFDRARLAGTATGWAQVRDYPYSLREPGEACASQLTLRAGAQAGRVRLRLKPEPASLPGANRELHLRLEGGELAAKLEVQAPKRGANAGRGCVRRLTVGPSEPMRYEKTRVQEFVAASDSDIGVVFEPISPEDVWLEPLAISSKIEPPLRAQALTVGEPPRLKVEGRKDARSIRVVQLRLASGRLEMSLAGQGKMSGSWAPKWYAVLTHRPLPFALSGLALLALSTGPPVWRRLRRREQQKKVQPEPDEERTQSVEPGAREEKTMDPGKAIFVSYTQADKAWAEWVAWTLEEAGHPVIIQAWDFRPGSNFVVKMQEALARRTVAILSEDYLKSAFATAEWAAAFATDPLGKERKLIPIRVAPCSPTGLLKASVYVDLVGLGERDAQAAILGAFSERNKPSKSPLFPGASPARNIGPGPRPPYPGS
jgi:hypothetical protein